MRRGISGETQFSSDSFLDIIANLVGILIILIVLAGLRAGTAPVEEEPIAEQSPTEPTLNAVSDPEPLLTQVEEPKSELPHFTPTLAEPASPLPAVAQPPTTPQLTADEAAQHQSELERSLAAIKARLNQYDIESASKSLQKNQSQLAEQSAALRELQEILAAEDAAARRSTSQLAAFDGEYQTLRARLIDANRELRELATAEPETERLDLRINPIGRRDPRANELLFLVSGGETLFLPVEELFEQIMRRESGNVDLTLRLNTQRGTVGPISGVSARYLVALMANLARSRVDASVSLVQRPVTTMQIDPEPNAPREPSKKALQPGGIFAGKLLSASSGTIVRLLIRTDSFEEGRELTSYARQRGFRVDAQPLRPAEPIRLTIGIGSNALAQ